MGPKKRYNNKEEKVKRWSQRVIKRQRRKEKVKKVQFTKMQRSKKNYIHKKELSKEDVVKNLENCRFVNNEISMITTNSIPVEKKTSLIKRLTSGIFFPVTFLLNFSMAKVNRATELIKKPFKAATNKYEELENRMINLEAEVASLKESYSNVLTVGNRQAQNVPAPPPAPPMMMAPPPPPPPPPPPLMKALPTKIIVPRSVKKLENPAKKEKTSNPQITQELLSTVTLRKVSTVLMESEKENKPSQGGALVTLSQLKNVKLKRTTAKKVTPSRCGQTLSVSKRTNLGRKSSDRKKTPDNLFKNRLRRSNIVRSPGGTPLVKNNYEMSLGDGLTPLLSNALKNKFKNAKPLLTPESEENLTSPTSQLNFNSPQLNLSPAVYPSAV